MASTSIGPFLDSYRMSLHPSHSLSFACFSTCLSFSSSLIVSLSRYGCGSCCTSVVASRIGFIVRSKRKPSNSDTFEENDKRRRIKMGESDEWILQGWYGSLVLDRPADESMSFPPVSTRKRRKGTIPSSSTCANYRRTQCVSTRYEILFVVTSNEDADGSG